MPESVVSRSITKVTDLRDTLREEALPNTARQSRAELELLLGELPTPSRAEPSSLEQLSAAVAALSGREHSQMSMALPTANRPTGSPGGELLGAAPLIVAYPELDEPTGHDDATAAASATASDPTRPSSVPTPVVPGVPRSDTTSSAPVSSGSGTPGATTRQPMLPLPTALPATPAGPGQARAAWLIILAGSQHPRGHVVPLTFGRRTRYRLGGDTSCEIVITSPVVSREHAEIGFDPSANGFFLVDLDSTNGTYVQPPGLGMYQVAGTAALRDNCLIWLGREQVRFSFRCY